MRCITLLRLRTINKEKKSSSDRIVVFVQENDAQNAKCLASHHSSSWSRACCICRAACSTVAFSSIALWLTVRPHSRRRRRCLPHPLFRRSLSPRSRTSRRLRRSCVVKVSLLKVYTRFVLRFCV